MTLANAQPLKVTMGEDTQTLDEVVVTALGIKREQKALSYNVQQVKGEALTAVKDANFINSLAGKVAGVQISSGATGAGGATRVVMRGMKSLTKNNNALYVIDGVPMFNTGSSGGDGQYGSMGGSDAVADLNPDDIESISMMTGPSAAALYGSAAANGVVLVNTKKGKKEKISLTVSNSTTFSKAYIMPEMQNRYGTSSGLFSWGDLTDKRYDPKDFFNTGSNIINSITLSTGSDKNQTYFSASTTNSDGILPNNSYNRYNFTARNTTNFLNDKLTLDIGAQYIIQNNTNMVSQGQYYNPLPALYLFPRGDNFDEIRLYERYDTNYGFMKQYWPYGDGGLSLQNPYWTQNRIRRTSDKKRYMLNASLKWKVTDWLNITGRVNLDNSDYRNKTEKYASTLATFCSVNGGFEDAMRQERSLYTDLMATVDKTFGDFRLNTNIGMSLYHTSMQTIGFAGDLIIPNFFALNNINYAANYKPLPDGYDDEVQSIFANVELGWRSQLYLTLTGRNDWDSKLAFSNQSSYFYPSVGLSAVLTEMFALPKIISYAKVRGSYTVVASSFDRYLTNPGYEYNSQTHNWANPTVYPMDNLKPEKTKSWEIGLNLKFWENRFNLDATYYRSNTLNQTFKVDIPSSSGYNKAIVQTGNVQNQGIELALGFTDEWAGFRWASNATFTLNRNKVKRLAGGSTNPVTGELIDMPNMPVGWLGKENVAPRVILTEGGTMTDIYVYNELTKDNNGNIKVDAQTGGLSMHTAETPTKVGNLNANYNLGWTNNFTYKGINLGVVLSARVGGLAYSATQGVLDYYGVSSITANARDNKGVPMNNGKVDTQKYYQTIGTGEGGYGRYYLYSATNVRLQELSLSYTLPKKWLNNVANVTFGLVGRNLWMIYCKAPFDPELSASTSSNYYMNVDYFMQPSMRNIGFNVKVQF
ncbi:SusC/RagA family TonB-linked outer membrane protein [Bacteroides thetaiotaomicron]|uniref:SusC/RagA family TonB-linked outer membrane protein n=1 Tax=Bacteroides thetaiotaomicron TaxID=818 RepID=UPI0009BCBBD5|nr:SusC/RagA family TonB-linked outer membrane protein [Bacteroides thetaiotaomicron]MDC2233760.1 SusC/RagA family TonB-linked outer membrane protein [Bacteroides thetaiotaomicron]RGV71593.1 SusC/RagA family TonB-linked outer membrane protein [Bacteroides thetaiotaomicron]RHF21100.1 SusC/RagA family TonB-linked outer membrane protein [Bacteroides thetaiotaomicron]